MAPRDPSNCRGWMRLTCGPAFQQTVRTARATTTKSGMRSAELTCPLYTATLSGPQRERRLKATAGCCLPGLSATGRRQTGPPLRYYRTQGRMGARVMASGMPGASRCAVVGGATYSVVKVSYGFPGPCVPRRVRISATSLARVQRGGVNPGPCARGFGALSLPARADWLAGTVLKLALRVEYSTSVRGCVKEMDGWGLQKSLTCTFTYPCQ